MTWRRRIDPNRTQPKHADVVVSVQHLLSEMKTHVEKGQPLSLLLLIGTLNQARLEVADCTTRLRITNSIGADPSVSSHSEFVGWVDNIMARMYIAKDGILEQPFTMQDIIDGEKALRSVEECDLPPDKGIWFIHGE